jgi:hypothetical protein
MEGVDPTRLARRPDQKYNPATGLPNQVEANVPTTAAPEATTAPEAEVEDAPAPEAEPEA